MKKQAISLLLTGVMVLSGGVFAFAAEAAEKPAGAPVQTGTPVTTTAAIAPDMTFTGTPVKLSLAQAVKHMQTESVSAETAKINKQSNIATAEGYAESASSIRDTLRALNEVSGSGGSMNESAAAEAAGATVVNEKVVRLQRDFAKANIDNNYQAEMNQIESDTVALYYGVLQATDALKAAEDNLNIQKEISANTQKKFKLGVIAKKDVQSAETAVVNAVSDMSVAQTKLATAKMNFNLLMGYPLMQSVAFTDTLKAIDAPTVTLFEAIKSALANRMEIKAANMSVEINQIILENMKYTVATNSSKYLGQEVAYRQSQQGAKIAPLNVELDVRTNFMAVQDSKKALEAALSTQTMAKEGYRLATISYDAGVNTLTDVQNAQLQSFKAGQGVSAAITAYDLAVYDYGYAQGVGKAAVKTQGSGR